MKNGIGLENIKVAEDLDTFTIPLTSDTVIRICRKIYLGNEVIDCRLWFRNKKNEQYYPRKGQGMCLRPNAWKEILGVFNNNLVLLSNAS